MDATAALWLIVTKATITLLPLVPAYVLFKTLRSHARVTGPMAGLKVQLSGAFGGYFIVFVVLFQGVDARVSTYQYHDWTVAGRVEFQTDGDKPNPHNINSYMKPPALPIDTDGKFEFKVPMKEYSDGRVEWPTILMEIGGFEQGVLRLAPNLPGWGAEVVALNRDQEARVINVTEPMRLKPQTYSAGRSENAALIAGTH